MHTQLVRMPPANRVVFGPECREVPRVEQLKQQYDGMTVNSLLKLPAPVQYKRLLQLGIHSCEQLEKSIVKRGSIEFILKRKG